MQIAAETTTRHTGEWTVVERVMPALTYSGRNGKRKPHAVLLTPEGRQYLALEPNKFRSMDGVKAELQVKADARNDFLSRGRNAAGGVRQNAQQLPAAIAKAGA